MARPSYVKDPAYFFLKKIKSPWKGYEDFAIWLVEEMKSEVVVDLGMGFGLSTCAFAFPNQGKVYGIDWFEEMNFTKKAAVLDSAYKNISELSSLRNLKNFHLIIGDYEEVVETWKLPIDILHIDWVFSYEAVKKIYQSWSKYLKKNGVLLVHDIEKEKASIGRFFESLDFPKIRFSHGDGLGVLTQDEELLKKITRRWKRNC